MLDKSFLEKVESMCLPPTVDIPDRLLVLRDRYVPLTEALAEPLTVRTLTAVADYLRENTDGLELDHLLLHVVDPTTVAVLSRLFGPEEQRQRYVVATDTGSQPFQFGKWYGLEEFNIALQALFVPDEMTALLLKLVGNVVGSDIGQFDDDGVSQKVTARRGVVSVAEVVVPNPVLLAPYRTFREVEQPASRFVYRMKQGSAGDVQCALFEADGGAWRLEAVQRVREWLQGNVPVEVAVLA